MSAQEVYVSLRVALCAVVATTALCATVVAGFVATAYVDTKFGAPWSAVMGFASILMFVFVAAFLIALRGSGGMSAGWGFEVPGAFKPDQCVKVEQHVPGPGAEGPFYSEPATWPFHPITLMDGDSFILHRSGGYVRQVAAPLVASSEFDLVDLLNKGECFDAMLDALKEIADFGHACLLEDL